jgi:putative ABC transport system permease protein
MGIDTFSIINYSTSNTQKVEQNSSGNSTQELEQLWRPPFASVIHPDFATELNLNNGQILSLENDQFLPKLAVTAIEGLGREIVMDIGQLQRISGTQKISELLVIGEKKHSDIDALKVALPDHLRIEIINTGDQAQQLTGSFHLNPLAMACLWCACLFS